MPNKTTESTDTVDRQALFLRLPEPLHRHLKEVASEQGTTMTTLAIVLLTVATGYDGLSAPTPKQMKEVARAIKRYAVAQESADEESPEDRIFDPLVPKN